MSCEGDRDGEWRLMDGWIRIWCCVGAVRPSDVEKREASSHADYVLLHCFMKSFSNINPSCLWLVYLKFCKVPESSVGLRVFDGVLMQVVYLAVVVLWL